jgi:hypothetical protein
MPRRLNGPRHHGRVRCACCLTHEGDCHGKEESQEEIREKEEVTERNPAKNGQEEDRRQTAVNKP